MQSLRGVSAVARKFFKMVSELSSDKDSQIARFSVWLLARILGTSHTYAGYFTTSLGMRESMDVVLLNSSILGRGGSLAEQFKELKLIQKAVKRVDVLKPTVYIIKRDKIKGRETLSARDMMTMAEFYDSSSSEKNFPGIVPGLFDSYYVLYIPKISKLDLELRSGKKNKAAEGKRQRISLAVPMNGEKRAYKEKRPTVRKFTLNSSTNLPMNKNPLSLALSRIERSGLKKNTTDKGKNFYSNSHLKMKCKTSREERDNYFNIYQKSRKNTYNSPSKPSKPKYKNKTNRRITLNLKSVNFTTKSVYIPKIHSNRKKPANPEKKNGIGTTTTLSSMFGKLSRHQESRLAQEDRTQNRQIQVQDAILALP